MSTTDTIKQYDIVQVKKIIQIRNNLILLRLLVNNLQASDFQLRFAVKYKYIFFTILIVKYKMYEVLTEEQHTATVIHSTAQLSMYYVEGGADNGVSQLPQTQPESFD